MNHSMIFMKRLIEVEAKQRREAEKTMQREAEARREAEEAMRREAEETMRREAEETMRREVEEAVRRELQAEIAALVAEREQIAAQRERLARAPPRIDQATIIEAAVNLMIRDYNISERIRDLDFNVDRVGADKMFMLGGKLQAGKTNTMLSYIMSCVLHGCKATIVVRNLTQDENYIMQSAKNMVRAVQAYLHQALNGYVFHSHVYDISGVQDWATSEYVTDVIVVMANVSQLKKLRNGIVDHNVRKYLMAVDESDSLMNTVVTAKEVDVFKLMKECYDMSHTAIFVSATHFATWFTEGSMTSNYIAILNHPNYKGIESLIHIALPARNRRQNADIFVQSPDLSYFLDAIVNQPPFDIDHPIHGLAKVSHLTSHHNQILNAIRDSDVWGPELAAVIFNGEGITMYHHSFRGLENLVLDRHNRDDIANVGVRVSDGVFKFEDANLKKAWTYMRTHGGTDRFPRVVTIAGLLANRCQNFTDMDYQEHLTHQMIDLAGSATAVDAEQSLRILGIHQNPTELKLYATQQTYDDIVKTHTNVNEFLVEAAANNPNQEFVTMSSQVQMHRDKKPARAICKKPTPFRFVTNERDDNTASFIDVAEPEPESEDESEMDDVPEMDDVHEMNAERTIVVDESRMKQNLKRDMYLDVKRFMLDTYGMNTWIPRSDVLGGMGYTYQQMKTVCSYFTRMHQNASAVTCTETRTGFLIKKEGASVYFRIN
jgi:hypothetical protein